MRAKKLGQKELRILAHTNIRKYKEALRKFQNKDYIMGIDHSLNNTAITVTRIGKKSFTPFNSPDICRDTKQKMYCRISAIRSFLIENLKKYKPRLIVMEGYAFSKMQNNELLGEVGGTIRMAFWDNPKCFGGVLIVSPTQLKKYILGSSSGDVSKERVMMKVATELGFETRNNNEADSIVLAKIGKDLNKFILKQSNDIPSTDDEKALRIYFNDAWKEKNIPKYRWDVLISLLKKRGDTFYEYRRE